MKYLLHLLHLYTHIVTNHFIGGGGGQVGVFPSPFWTEISFSEG